MEVSVPGEQFISPFHSVNYCSAYFEDFVQEYSCGTQEVNTAPWSADLVQISSALPLVSLLWDQDPI